MFSFPARKSADQPLELEDVFDPDAPFHTAIAITASIIERKLEMSQHWTRQARAALKEGDLEKCNGFLFLAKETGVEAIVLMQSADLLHEETL